MRSRRRRSSCSRRCGAPGEADPLEGSRVEDRLPRVLATCLVWPRAPAGNARPCRTLPAGMPRCSALPIALLSTLLLSACGARSSLEPGSGAECGWSARDGVAGLATDVTGLAMLDDGGLLLSMQDTVPSTTVYET